MEKKSESEWDISVWCPAIAHNKLWKLKKRKQKSVYALLDVRNRIAHNESTEIDSAEYEGMHQKLINNYRKLLGSNAETHIAKLEESKNREC